MSHRNIVISAHNTIKEALVKLNSIRDVSRLILFVEDENNKILGSLTDGDIRRSLAKDADLLINVGEICNRNFIL